MFNIGTGEMVIILVAALLLLGPERLPELARGIGKFLREFRRQTDEVRGMVEREFYRMDQDIKAVASLEDKPAGEVPGTGAAPLALPELKPPEGAVAKELKARPDEPKTAEAPKPPQVERHGG